MTSKNKLVKVAQETLGAVKAKKYKTPSGRTLSLDKPVYSAVRRSELFVPQPEAPYSDMNRDEFHNNSSPEITVTHESTLEAAHRLKDDDPCVLNFASAKNPGGGFLWGSIAQEETIARASALYECIIQFPEYYEENKRSERDTSAFYLDYAIYSPDVPIFRNDACDFLDEIHTTSIVTSPAPKRNKIEQDIDGGEFQMTLPEMEVKLEKVLEDRLAQVLYIMADGGHKTIVLGAWGCGAFGNDPDMVTRVFKRGLTLAPHFDKVVFAIYDKKDSDVFKKFSEVFG